MKSVFSMNWLRSIQPRKQRKFRYNAPLHTRGKFLSVTLSKDLKKKHNVNAIRVRTGDTVSVSRGQFKSKSGAVERVDLGRERVFVTGVEIVKKDGAKVMYPIHPSNLMITTLISDDKKRFKIRNKTQSSDSQKPVKKESN